MSKQRLNILTPAGRIVWGSVDKANTIDGEGKPKLIKNGPNTGKPTQSYDFGLAIPKGPEKHWKDTAWGAPIYNLAVQSWPRGEHQAPSFAFKVQDGDSTVPNRKGRKPCDREGCPGNWVLSFSSQYAPQLYKLEGNRPIPVTPPETIKAGYWVQISGSCASNDSTQNPGIFLNHNMVCLVGIDKEIVSGPDAAAVGFGQDVALPAGVSMTNFNLPAPATMAPLPVAQPAPAPVQPAQVAVQSHPGFLNPGVPTVPIAAAPPPVPQSPRMSAKANGVTYEQMIAAGWTPPLLIEHGYLAQ